MSDNDDDLALDFTSEAKALMDHYMEDMFSGGDFSRRMSPSAKTRREEIVAVSLVSIADSLHRIAGGKS